MDPQTASPSHRNRVGLFVSGEPSGGGKFQYCLAVLESLLGQTERNFELAGAAESPLWREAFRRYGVECVLVPTAGWTDRWRRFSRFLRLPLRWRRKLARLFDPQAMKMASLRCDLWIFPSHDEAAVELPFRSIVTVHDLMHRYETEFPELLADDQYESRETFFKGVCATASGVLVDSEVGKRQFVESYSFPAARVHVLPYVPYLYPDRDADLSRFSLPERFIFYPAQFWKHKNHANLLRALHLLKAERGEAIDLVLVGSKKNGYDECIQLARELGVSPQVHFLGYVEEKYIPAIYEKAVALVMPSLLGPTNIPQLEAFLFGCPVATSRIYGIPDQVGDAALLFDPRSVDEIADAVHRLWSDAELRASLVEKGRAKAKAWGQPQFGARLARIVTDELKQT
jgi:glycosyltransferase involved in cell wall biosynthesis